jgi:hypothetical protein
MKRSNVSKTPMLIRINFNFFTLLEAKKLRGEKNNSNIVANSILFSKRF